MDDVPFHRHDITASHMDDVIPSNTDDSIVIHKDDVVSFTWQSVAYINGDTTTHLDGMAITHVNVLPAKLTEQCAFSAHGQSSKSTNGCCRWKFFTFNFEHAHLML